MQRVCMYIVMHCECVFVCVYVKRVDGKDGKESKKENSVQQIEDEGT